MFNTFVQSTLTELLTEVNKKVNNDKIITHYVYHPPKKCIYQLETKLCNKKTGSMDVYCKKHTKIVKMESLDSVKNDNIDNWGLELVSDCFYKDVFNMIFKLDGEDLIYHGHLIDDEIIEELD